MDVRRWFDQPAPRPCVPSRWVRRALEPRRMPESVAGERRCVWMGGEAVGEGRGKRATLRISSQGAQCTVRLPSAQAIWLEALLRESAIGKARGGAYPSWRDARQAFPGTAGDWALFVTQPSWTRIRAAGLLLV